LDKILCTKSLLKLKSSIINSILHINIYNKSSKKTQIKKYKVEKKLQFKTTNKEQGSRPQPHPNIQKGHKVQIKITNGYYNITSALTTHITQETSNQIMHQTQEQLLIHILKHKERL
jgi:uncharacterized membrane protein